VSNTHRSAEKFVACTGVKNVRHRVERVQECNPRVCFMVGHREKEKGRTHARGLYLDGGDTGGGLATKFIVLQIADLKPAVSQLCHCDLRVLEDPLLMNLSSFSEEVQTPARRQQIPTRSQVLLWGFIVAERKCKVN